MSFAKNFTAVLIADIDQNVRSGATLPVQTRSDQNHCDPNPRAICRHSLTNWEELGPKLWPHQVKWVVSEQQKLLKLGYYMDKLRFFVWIILNDWIMIIYDPFTLPCQLAKCVTPQVFSPSFRWESNDMPVTAWTQVTDEGRGSVNFPWWANQLTLVICSWCRDIWVFPYSKWWVSPKHLQMIMFSRKNHGCWGNPPF